MTTRDPFWWLARDCGCGGGCPPVIRTPADLEAVRVAHPEEFTGVRDGGPSPSPYEEWERQIEEGRNIPKVEREGGLITESWAESPG